MKQLNKMLVEFDSKGVFPYDKELSEVAEEKNGLDSEYDVEMMLIERAKNDVSHPYHKMVI